MDFSLDEKLHQYILVYPDDPKIWKTNIAPLGALRSALASGKTYPPPSWMTAEERKENIEALMRGGLIVDLQVHTFKLVRRGCQNAEMSFVYTFALTMVSLDKYVLNMPIFFGAALEDYIGLPSIGGAAVAKACTNVTVKDFQANHWPVLQVPDRELLSWIRARLKDQRYMTVLQ
ncbi:hypothetical protein BDP27DRAFT_1420893 [Rhodocollybia butyracea]|uniref:Uncharacterized protein n=1 Tax=Rhodocollybia butyracea TaxID=206335 RepID=A0A9P5PU36_9AGAR|nr:hypothetical protein BDP27DRAFT_1420893 [Rhodocollybia butyracea]